MTERRSKFYLLVALLFCHSVCFAGADEAVESIKRQIQTENQSRRAWEKRFDEGLVLKATFDAGDLSATVFDPETGAERERIAGVLSGASDAVEFVDGICGKGLRVAETTEDPKSVTNVTFPIKDLVSDTGSFVLWVHTRARLGEGTKKKYGMFTVFRSGKARLRKWWTHKFGLNHGGGGIRVYHDRMELTGWRQYAVTWNARKTRIFIDGRLLGEGDSNVLLPVAYLNVGPEKTGEKARTIDEVRVYDRALSAAELRRNYLSRARPATRPLLTAPMTKEKIIVDGKLTPAEWDEAAKTIGFLDGEAFGDVETGEMNGPLATLMVQRDQKNLYVVCQSRWPGYALEARQQIMGMIGMLTSTTDEKGRPGKDDDLFEVLLSSPGDESVVRRLAVNGKNKTAEKITEKDSPVEAVDSSENIEWDVKTEVRDEEWVMEARIPLAAMGLSSSSGDGQAIGFNVVRDWSLLRDGAQSWAWGTRRETLVGDPPIRCLDLLREQAALGELRLGGGDDPVTRIDQVGELGEGVVDFKARLINPAANPVRLRVSLTTRSGSVGEKKSSSWPPSTRSRSNTPPS